MEQIWIGRKQEFKTTQWSGGATTEIKIFPETSRYLERNFEFRLSAATITAEKSTFTSLPAYSRILIPTAHEINLVQDGIGRQARPFEKISFPGAATTVSYGKSADVNLMYTSGWVADMNVIAAPVAQVNLNHDFTGLYVATGKLAVGRDDNGFSEQLDQGDVIFLSGTAFNSVALALTRGSRVIQVVLDRAAG